MITGYASVFWNARNSATQYRLGADYVERIMPGAFDEALTSGDEVVALFNHDPNKLLGRRSAGTLRLAADKTGLHYEIDEADTSISKDVAAMQQRRDVIGSSFGFLVTNEENRVEDGMYIREITGVSLRDVGPVTFPAYEGTERAASMRCVTVRGECMPVPEQIAAEVRSAFAAPVYSSVSEKLAQISLDDVKLGGHNPD